MYNLSGNVFSGGSGLEVHYNTLFNVSGGMNSTTSAWNNIAQNCGNPGIGGQGNYNCATNNTADYSGTIDAEDLVADPLFADPLVTGDFRLKVDSPCYNTAEPNNGIQACRGAHTCGVELADNFTSATTAYTISFVPFGDIPSSGQIEITFPAGFNLLAVTNVITTSTWGTTAGTFSFYVTGQVLTITRNGDGTVAPALGAQNLIIQNVQNGNAIGQFYYLIVGTREGNSFKLEGDYIDYPRESNYFELVPAGFVLVDNLPPNYSTVSLTPQITCVFSTNIVRSSVTNNYTLQDSNWDYASIIYSFTNSDKTALMSSSQVLQPNEFYTVTLTTNLESGTGGNLSYTTQLHFYTTTRNETGHRYSTNRMNGSLADWDLINNVTYNTTGVEKVANDTGDNQWGQTSELWATWDTNYLYIAIKKAVAGSVEDWYDYIAIDVTRDDQGATSNPVAGDVNAFTYDDNRRPEYLLWFDHDDLFFPVWQEYRRYDWNGTTWVQNSIDATNMQDDGNQVLEVRLPWSMFGGVPNRISLCAYTFRASDATNVFDFCPGTVSGPTNWVTIDPDNNGDEIPDGASPPMPKPQIALSKYITNVTLSSSSLGSNVLPGSTIHYEICWSNKGNVALTGVILFDKIPDNTYYVFNSLTYEVVIGSSVWIEEWSTSLGAPIQSYVSPQYSSIEPVPADTCTWLRTKTIDLPSGESGYMRFKVTAGNLPAGSQLTNITFFTCMQVDYVSGTGFSLIVSTQYGGAFSLVSDITGASIGTTNYFNVDFTNKGNITTSFSLIMSHTNSITSLSYFDIAIVTNEVVISSMDNLDSGVIFSFQVRIIATDSLLKDGDWLDFRLRAQAENNTDATNYMGDDGIRYGGDIGEDWNGVKGANPGYIYHQDSWIRLQLYGAPVMPLLEITKSVSNIRLGGIPLTRSIPGSTASYMISYSNAGAADADNAIIYDEIPANTGLNTNYMLPPTAGWTVQYSTNVNPGQSYGSIAYSATYTSKTNVKWVRWIKSSVGTGEQGTFIYTVIIK